MKVYLCLEHHVIGAEAVHNNKKNMRILQQWGQAGYEKKHTRQQFVELFGRNYLEHEKREPERQQEFKERGFCFLEENK